jgi:hypothetical protein
MTPSGADHCLLDSDHIASGGAPDRPLLESSTLEKGKRRTKLRSDLREMRDAIDDNKDMADAKQIRVEVAAKVIRPDLETLVKGWCNSVPEQRGKKSPFLRMIPPVDPITGQTE